MSSTLRESIESASEPVVAKLATLPRAVMFLVVLALMLGGAYFTWGWVLIAVVLVFLTWILYLSWPRLRGPERLLRVAVLAIVLAVIITKAFPQ